MSKEKLQFESSTWESNVISGVPMDGENSVRKPDEHSKKR